MSNETSCYFLCLMGARNLRVFVGESGIGEIDDG